MPVNRYDQGCRYLAKRDPVALLGWLLRETPEELRFRTWLDARTLPFPGDPERICDTVAWLGDADPAVEWAVPLEFCLDPDGDLFGRLLIYLGQLWLEIRPTDAGRERFWVGAAVVNLRGIGNTSRDMVLRRTGVRTFLGIAERDLADENAAAVLAGIADGTAPRCPLAWIPLMHGGGEAAIIQQWLDLARQEPDSRRRSDYGGLAVVFAEAAGCRKEWKEALKGWNMEESQQVLEWIAEGEARGEAKGEARGEARGEANALVRLLEKRFPPGAPADAVAAIRSSTDVEQLRRWFDLAVEADSLAAFRQKAGL
jgi:hypothetical protein